MLSMDPAVFIFPQLFTTWCSCRSCRTSVVGTASTELGELGAAAGATGYWRSFKAKVK